jgi:predicted dienelactone hydrolase
MLRVLWGPLLPACLALAGCGGSDEDVANETPPPIASPTELGPYAIGVTTRESEPDAQGRVLPVEIWYPARTLGKPGDPYELFIGTLKLAEIDSPNGAVRDAARDLRGAPYPVVVFSHGNGGVRAQSFYLTEYLASHGFVVVSPDHVGNTMSEMVNEALALPPAEAARLRPSDVSLALDTALASNFGSMLDAERIGAAGHSFGGYTVLRLGGASMDVAAVATECESSGDLLCDGWDELTQPFPETARDPRVKAILAQAPGGASVLTTPGHAGFADVAVPAMVQGGTTDQITPWQTEQVVPFGQLSSPAFLVGLQGAGHFTFSNMCDLVALIGLTLPELDDGCGDANMPAPEAHALANRYATAFFQVYVAGEHDFESLLDPSLASPPGIATFESR